MSCGRIHHLRIIEQIFPCFHSHFHPIRWFNHHQISLINPSIFSINYRKTVGAYRIRPSWQRGCMLNDDVMLGVIISFSIVQPSHYPWIDRTGVGAYRIHPPWRRGCMFDEGVLFAVIISFSPIWGRMRYAPTHVRLKTNQTTSWQNHQINRDDADTGYTKPSKRSRRCWLGSHKTLKTVATTELCSHSLANAIATVKMLHRSQYRC